MLLNQFIIMISFLYGIQLYELFGDIREAPPLISEKVYQKYLNEKSFYTQLFGIESDKSLEECITYHLNIFNQKLLKERNIDSSEKEYFAYYFAASQMIILKKWIQDGMVVSPKKIAEINQKLINDSFFKNYYPE